MTQVKVEHYPELRRDEYSKGITNIDNDAYTRYMHGAVVRKQRNSTLEENTKEINNLKKKATFTSIFLSLVFSYIYVNQVLN